jgi:hypothetical protein
MKNTDVEFPSLAPLPDDKFQPFSPVPAPPAAPLELASVPLPVRLDLACGQRPREGFEGVDLYAPGARKVDLLRFPWPWSDGSVDELNCSHFVEHIPARNIDQWDVRDCSEGEPDSCWTERLERWRGVDMLFAFFDEAHRVLKPGGKLHVVVPALQSVRAFQDPTHRRFIPAELFFYLNADWRKAQGLDHYRVRANFAFNVNPTIPAELTLLSPEAQGRRIREGWNTTADWVADLVALKP